MPAQRPNSIETPADSGLIVEESSPDCLRVRTCPLSTGLRNFTVAIYCVLMGWIIWSTGSELITLIKTGANPATKGQTAAIGHGTADELFSILVGSGVSTIFVSAIGLGVLWLACGYQRLRVQGGLVDYEARLGSLRLAHHHALITDVTGASIAEVGAQANDDLQAMALVITTPQWKVKFGASATFPALQQLLGEIQRMKAVALAEK